MNKVKHTPGPYLIDGNTIYALEHHGWRKGEETFHNRFYAYVYPERNCPSEEAEAVAKLFAAAPEMLEACKGIYAGVVSDGRSPDRLNINISFAAFKAVEAAIAKADGV